MEIRGTGEASRGIFSSQASRGDLSRHRVGGTSEREREREREEWKRERERENASCEGGCEGRRGVEKANIGTMVSGDSGRGKWARAVLVVVAGRAVAQHEIPSNFERLPISCVS